MEQMKPSNADYERFGVAPDAPPREVRAKWREHLMNLHPDHGGTTEEFFDMRERYHRVLSAATSCKTCGGAGKILKQSGFAGLYVVCPSCGGSGEVE